MKSASLFLFLLTQTCVAQLTAADTLANVERAFAKKSHDTNVRDAFLQYFAVDGIVFNPGPVTAQQLYGKRPPLPVPPPFTLDWSPAYAEVSQFGDLGFTTGPYRLTENTKHTVTDHGTFFSVWEKQADKSWKVMLDFGVPTSTARDLRANLTKGLRSNFHEKAGISANAEAHNLMAVEAALNNGDAYDRALSSKAFVVQDGLQALTTEPARRRHLSNMKSIKAWKPMGGGVAKNGDLAYVYGAYQANLVGSQTHEVRVGYYARMWKRNDAGQWKIVLDNTQALRATPLSAVTP